MLHTALRGGAAGAAGTMALDIVSYGDAILRARPSSTAPARVAGVFADRLGIDLSVGGANDEQVQSRLSGIGALMGYATGLGIGIAYGVLRPRLRDVSTPLAGVALGLTAMLASDIPLAATGVSDPRQWSPVDWASDLAPHLAYGLITAVTYEAFVAR